MSDKEPIKTEENPANQNTDPSSWFYVENDQEGKDLLNARTWDVSRRIIDDSSSQGNLHYGNTTQKDLIQTIDKAPETFAALGTEEPVSDAAPLTDTPDHIQTEASASATPAEALAPQPTEDREVFTAEEITGKQGQEVDDHPLASAPFIVSDPTELPTDDGRRGMEQKIVNSRDDNTVADEIAVAATPTGQSQQAAVITGIGESVTEDDGVAVSGKLDITDANTGEAAFAPESVTGEYGAFTIDATGTWTYSLANDQENVQGLVEGERVTDTFTVASVDGTTHSLIIAINGTNDTAVIGGTTTAIVTEDLGKEASGSLTIDEADSGEAHFQAGEVLGDFGTLTIDEKGNWNYALDNSNQHVQALGAGEKTEDVIIIKSTDGTEQKITVSITGTNDGPVISAAASPIIAAAEDTNILIRPEQLLANATDVDGDSLSVTNLHVIAGGTIPVTLKISGDHYDPKNIDDVGAGSPRFQVSVNGQVVTVDGESTFTVEAMRGQWEYFTVNVPANTAIESVAVRFVNDAYDNYDNDKDGKLYEDRNLIVDKINVGGQVTDAGTFVGGVTLEAEKAYYDAPKATGYETMPWSGSLKFDVSVVEPSEYSPLSVNADGTWTLQPGSNFNGTIQLAYDVVDGHGGTTAATTAIEVAAVNDGAVIAGQTTSMIAEDTTTQLSGKLTIADVDSGEAHFQAGEVHGDFGTLKIDEKGTWNYALDNTNHEVQALGAGEKTEDVLVVKSADGTEQKITVSITGTNDGPVATADTFTDDLGDRVAGAHSGIEVTGIYMPGSTVNLLDGIEDPLTTSNTHQYFEHSSLGNTGYNYMGGHNWFVDHNISLTGLTGGVITFSDGTTGVIDTAYNGVGTRADGTVWNESAYVYYRAYDDVEIGSTVAVGEDLRLTLNTSTLLANDSDIDGDALSVTGVRLVDQNQGTLTLANGQIVFTPANSLDVLDNGETATVQFTYTVGDGHGGSSTALAEFTVLGTNDRPVVSAPVDLGSTAEDRSLFIRTDQLLANATDVDGEVLSVSQIKATDASGKVAGILTAATENGVAGFIFTPASDFNGENVQISYKVSDGTASTDATAVIDVSAVNDLAQTSGTTTGTVAEDAATNTVTGVLTVTDVDSGEAHFQAGEVHGDFGTLKIDEKGTWSYALDNTNQDVQALGAGEKTEDVLVVKSADGTEQKITVSISGTNDGPVVSAAAPPLIAAAEDTNIVIHPAELLTNASDIDGDTLAVTNLHVIAGGTIPVTLKISGDHYDPKNIDDLVAGAPQFQVSINGHTVDVDGVSTFSVGAMRGQWEYHTVNVSADTVIESVTVRFVNDAYDSYDNDKDGKLYEDRNLIVDKINIGGQVADSGAFVGGVTLEAEKAYYDTPKATGYETMPWSGSLKFDVSAVPSSEYSPISSNSDGTWTLRPGSNFNGTIQLGYDVVDGHGGTTAATTVIKVATVNDEAHISGTTIGTVVEDAAAKSVTGVLKVTDVDSGEAHFQAAEVHGDFGTLTIDEAGNWNYALDNNNQHVQALGAGEKTEDVIIVKSADGTEQKITVSINGTNDGPVVSSPALLAGGNEDTSVTFSVADLLATSSDADKTDTMTVANVTVDPAQGSLADNGDGTYTLKPADNYNGQVTIHYDVTDGTETVAASSTIDLKAVNDNPVAVDDATPSIAFDLPKGGAIVSSGDDVTVVKGEIVAEGQTGSSVDKWTFHHNGGALTIDTLSESGKNFIDIDGDGAKDHIDLMVRLYDNDGKQIAVDDDSSLGGADGSTNDFFSHVQDSYIQIGNLPPGDYTLAIGSWDLGHQEVVDNHNNNADTGISYNHEQDIGPYQITFTGDISFIEDGPLTTDEDSALIIKAETLLANDTDVEGDSLAILAVSHEVVDAAGNVVGTAELDPDGNVVFTPGEALDALTDGESQKVSLSYTVSDGQGGTSTANATININGSDDRAVIGGIESGTVGEDQSLETSGKLTIDDASDTAIAEQQSLPQAEGAPETSTLEDQGADFIEASEPIAIGLAQSELPSNAVETSGLEDVNPSETSAMGSDNSIDTGETTTGSGITEEQGVTPPGSPDQFLVTDAAVEDIPSMNEQAETAVETQNEVSDAGLDAQDSVICEPDDSPPATHYETIT